MLLLGNTSVQSSDFITLFSYNSTSPNVFPMTAHPQMFYSSFNAWNVKACEKEEC